jgi:hypothetical protein
MKARTILFFFVAAALVMIGCGGSEPVKSTSLNFDMAVLQNENGLLGGTVYHDLNSDGVMDIGEPGIEGVTVTLVGIDDVLTDPEGHYSFAVTTAGVYVLVETDPDGYFSTTPNEVHVELIGEQVVVNFGDDLTDGDVEVDVKPGSEVNPVNFRSNGVLPVAILGSQVLDVSQIDPDSILLQGVAPLRWSFEDVGGPYDGSMDPMTEDDMEIPDGYEDMTLKFSTQEIVAAIGGVVRGDTVILTMEAALFDGTPILGEETILVVQAPK